MAKRKRLTPARLAPGTPSAANEDDPAATLPAPPASDATSRSEPPAERRRPPIAGIAGEAAAIAALNEVGQGLESARADGRLLLKLRLNQIDTGYLVRDRIAFDAEEMEALVESLRRRGQQTAIEVTDLGEANAAGRWGLISGWRRVTALRQLGATEVLAAVRRPDGAKAAYQAMVEENEIRAALSYYERARIVVRATQAGVFPDDRTALAELFASASRPRRSKIGSFMRIVHALDGVLRFPAALTERQGLALVKALDADPGLADRLNEAISAADPADPETEALIIGRALAAPSKAPRPRARAEELRPGLMCRESEDEMVLRGPALSDELRQKIRNWLREPG